MFVRVTDDYRELSGRSVVRIGTARIVKDEMIRRVVERFAAEGPPVVSSSQEVTVRHALDDWAP